MRESSLTESLVNALSDVLPGAIIFKHFDVSTSGIPDLSVTWGGRTVWIEVKYAAPTTVIRPIQAVTMPRLAKSGIAYWVTYHYTHAEKWIIIQDAKTLPVFTIPKHNHKEVARIFKDRIERENAR